jgi:uncharacterized protein (DUF433 family)
VPETDEDHFRRRLARACEMMCIWKAAELGYTWAALRPDTMLEYPQLTTTLRSSENNKMNDQKWIVSDKDHLGGKPRVQGTRISVAFLLECLANGMSVAEIVDAYPTLSENAVQGALRELAHEKESAAA